MGIRRRDRTGTLSAGRLGRGLAAVTALAVGGCANPTVRITDTERTGSEQLLLTGMADRAIACLDFRPLAGARVHLDAAHVGGPDAGWLTFSLRRAMARQGLLLVDEAKDAQVIVEAATGAYGTDQVDCRLTNPGIVPTGLLNLTSTSSQPSAFGRKSWQDAVVKLALVAFDAKSRRLIWESGTVLNTAWLDRRFFGTHEIRRSSSLPELDGYPRR